LLLEVRIEAVGGDSRAVAFQLVFVEIEENGRDIF